MDLVEHRSNILVIENNNEFEKFVLRLYEQLESDVDFFYTDEEKRTLFNKMIMICSPFDLQISEREIQKKLYIHLTNEIESSSLGERLREAYSYIVQSLEELDVYNDFELDYEEEFSTNCILKNFNVKLKKFEGVFCQRLIAYADVMHKLLAKDYIVLCNCDAYFNPEDYDYLEQWANYNEITILFLRNTQLIWPKECNEYIIDSDLCELH